MWHYGCSIIQSDQTSIVKNHMKYDWHFAIMPISLNIHTAQRSHDSPWSFVHSNTYLSRKCLQRKSILTCIFVSQPKISSVCVRYFRVIFCVNWIYICTVFMIELTLKNKRRVKEGKTKIINLIMIKISSISVNCC